MVCPCTVYRDESRARSIRIDGQAHESFTPPQVFRGVTANPVLLKTSFVPAWAKLSRRIGLAWGSWRCLVVPVLGCCLVVPALGCPNQTRQTTMGQAAHMILQPRVLCQESQLKNKTRFPQISDVLWDGCYCQGCQKRLQVITTEMRSRLTKAVPALIM